MTGRSKDLSAFQVPLGEHLIWGFLHGTRGFWRWLGRIESSVLRDAIERTPIDRPIYIAGLARAGSTVLLEIVASHGAVVTHRYCDAWSMFTPYWSQQAIRYAARRRQAPAERSHGDGLLVTPESPEAMEEMLWMAFFPHLHDPSCSSVLDRTTRHPRFEDYYRDHLRKLLLARGGKRYASKANYHVTRLEYLLELFPDARIVLPVRRPREHVASLRKQHALFLEAARDYPRSVAYLDRVGHFEFGQHRVPINAGDDDVARQIVELWQAGLEVRGWARYWAHIYGHLADRLAANAKLRDAVLIVRHEDLCADTEPTLVGLFQHWELEDASAIVRRYRAALHRPTYYQPRFNDEEEQAIEEETASVAQRFGYSQTATRDGLLAPLTA